MIRGTGKALEKSKETKRTKEDRDHWKSEHIRQKEVYKNLSEEFKKDLAIFLSYDDYGKGKKKGNK